MSDLRARAAELPLLPGVYLYKDAAARVIYVGKAKSLRLRVRSYFSDDRMADVKTGTLLSEATDIDYINAHGTSTPMGDEIELAAVERLFGNAAGIKSGRAEIIQDDRSCTPVGNEGQHHRSRYDNANAIRGRAGGLEGRTHSGRVLAVSMGGFV